MTVSPRMERAGTVIARWKATAGCVSRQDLARAAWQAAAGKKIAVHTAGLNLVRSHLIIEVTDEIWRRQLFSLRGALLHNLAKILGGGVVTELEFRVAPRRIGPGWATPAPAIRKRVRSADEADGIEDPILQMIYRSARGRASA